MTSRRKAAKRKAPEKARSSNANRRKSAEKSNTGAPIPADRFGPVPIVGIGASAGGLEALEQFFAKVPPESGMAFVVVQHLDPTHRGIMTELLQRTTAMPVEQAANRIKVKPNHVYVIPPNKDMSLLHGNLYLFEPGAPRGLRLPIDFFLRSLADDRREASIGVILSGMGSDGTLGLRAIKEKAGLTLVQAPSSAKFDGMPRSAIDAGVADIVAPVEELPQRIIGFPRRAGQIARTEAELESESKGGLEKIMILIRAHTGHDFSLYKKSTIYRRIERRMDVHQIDKIATYVRFLRENPQELDLLFRELLIGVTSFFRDPSAWESLRKKLLPALLKGAGARKEMRAWVPGCSTGEEAYSLAIVFKEALEKLKPSSARIKMQIFATDLDKTAIEKARQGFFPANIAADVSPERLKRFFAAEDNGYRVAKEIREMVVFAVQNLVNDPPFTKLDILSCRNLLIYLTPELQRTLLPLFHYSLVPGGILFLGNAETVGSFSELFAQLDVKERLFRRTGARVAEMEFPTRRWPIRTDALKDGDKAGALLNLQTQADQVLLRRFSPAAVMVNNNGDILYLNGRTGKYLEPAAGKANWNIHAMAREGLREALLPMFQKVIRQQGKATIKGLKLKTDGGMQTVDTTVEWIKDPESLRGMVVIAFYDVAAPVPIPRRSPKAAPNARQEALESETQRLRDDLRTTREEMQASQEELKSANEELQSGNEELQSTNEELTTSKEEMQSLNEELQTVNAELQSKVEDLSRAGSDMKNLLNSTDIATVFLDGAFHVRRFTSPATRIFKLIPGDVGRPLSDIVTELQYARLEDDAREVLRTLAFSEKQVPSRDGIWYSVRIMPCRTVEDKIDGVVMTFTDVSRMKKLESQLLAAKKEWSLRGTSEEPAPD
ncbi:MAG: PAS domain-containing protein [Betaproteobacteria bacterium]|nr:PAS domain-containing protein [Betaproteobacteria bacterium]